MSRERHRARHADVLDRDRRDTPLPGKTILSRRNRMQSELLVGALGMLLAAKFAVETVQLRASDGGANLLHAMPTWFWASCACSAAFALLVWLLRSATAPAALLGALVCINMPMRQELGIGWEQTAIPSLLALFLLTFIATRFGRSRKEAMGTAETRHGRRASQVAANLGVAGLFAAGGTGGSLAGRAMLAASIAALAEATADTVSSEAGQALSGSRWARTTLSITTGKPVQAGIDGGVSFGGTAAGALAAAVVVILSPFAHRPKEAMSIFASAIIGLLLDSVLGATLEQKGWLGNDLVNFISTCAAAALAFCATVLLG